MKRRTVVSSICTVGIAGLVGCSGDSGSRNSGSTEIIQVDPNNPSVGTPVAFTAADVPLMEFYDSSSDYFYFWAFGEDVAIGGRGRSTTHIFDRPGNQVVKLLVVKQRVIELQLDGTPAKADTFGDVIGEAMASNYDQHSTVINVKELPEEQLNIETGFVNIYLRGNRRNVAKDDPARLQFSASNLTGKRHLVVVLLLEVPTGLAVRGTSFDEGTGQYTTKYEIAPGSTKGESIDLVANEAGRYRIRGRAVYYFEDDPNNRKSKSTELTLNFRE